MVEKPNQEFRAGKELDITIAETVMGYWRDNAGNLLPPGFRPTIPWAALANGGAPPFSTDIAAAWTVLERLNLLETRILTKNEDGKYIICDAHDIGRWPEYYEDAAATASLAICLVALKASEV